MLPKERRIPRKLFGPILKEGKYSNSEHFSLRTAPESGPAKISVSISKKISKKAVIRNRVRRRVYAVVGGLLSELKPGLYLIIAKAGADKIKGGELKSELKSLVVSCRS